MTRTTRKLTPSLIFTIIAGLFAALTVLLFTILPMFSLGEGPESFATRSEGLAVYHKIWAKTKDKFIFTERLKDWSQWEHKFDDKITSKSDGIKYAKEMLASLKDDYTRVLDEKQTEDETNSIQGKFVGVGIQFIAARDSNNKLIPTKDESTIPLRDNNKHPIIHRVLKKTPAEAAGLKSGDIIVSVGDKSTVDLSMAELVNNIRGPEGTSVKLQIERGAKTSYVQVPRRAFDIEVVTYRRLPDNLGYIRIDSFISNKTGSECLRALKELKTCRGYVLDLRSNPGGLVTQAQDVMALFAKSGIAFRTRERAGDLILTGQAYITNSMPHIAADKTVVVLVDSGTASASEIVSGSLRDNRHAKLVGTQTFGKGLMQAVEGIDGDVLMHVTFAQWLTPNRVCPGSDPKTEHPNGLTVDVKCEMAEDFEFGTDKDNQLQCGISELKKELATSK